MTRQDQINTVQSYISAYNNFDVDGMAALVHPDIIFKNVASGKVNVETLGAGQFYELASKSKALFSSRQQKATNFRFTDDFLVVDIAYSGVLAVDLPDGMKAGETVLINGRSEFSFKDGRIFSITDFN